MADREKAQAIFSFLRMGIISREMAKSEWLYHLHLSNSQCLPRTIRSADHLQRLYGYHLSLIASGIGLQVKSGMRKAELASLCAPYVESLAYIPAVAIGHLRAIASEARARRELVKIVGENAVRDIKVPTRLVGDDEIDKENVLVALLQKSERRVKGNVLKTCMGITPRQARFEGMCRDYRNRWPLLPALRCAVRRHGNWDGVRRASLRYDPEHRRRAEERRRSLAREQREARRELRSLNC